MIFSIDEEWIVASVVGGIGADRPPAWVVSLVRLAVHEAWIEREQSQGMSVRSEPKAALKAALVRIEELETALREVAFVGSDSAPAQNDEAGFFRRQLHQAIAIATRALGGQ